MIDSPLLERVLARVASTPTLLERELAEKLRETFPGVHFTVCGEDDIPPRLAAAAGNQFCELYYIDGSEHCLKLTADAGAASGIVVALRGDDA